MAAALPNALTASVSVDDMKVIHEPAADKDLVADTPSTVEALKASVRSAKDRRASLDAPETGKRFAKAHKQAFLSDEQIAAHWIWRLFAFLVYPLNHFFHRITWANLTEKIDVNKPYLWITMHTTHNADIGYTIIGTQKHSGRVTRGLVHRNVMMSNPWLAYIGMVPGYRDTAVQLLQQNYWVGVIPGGGEEAMVGHENAYNLNWPAKRRGFAKVAIKARVPIVPVFYQNCEEMRWNPILWWWNKLHYGSRVYDYLVAQRIPFVSAAVKLIGELAWFIVATFFSIPMPAKVTAYVGEPIETSDDSDIDQVRERAYTALKQLIKQHQPNGIDRWRAAKQWWQHRQQETAVHRNSTQNRKEL